MPLRKTEFEQECAGTDYLDRFRNDGYAVVKGVFDPGEVKELSQAFDEIYAQGLRYRASFRDKNVLFRLAEDRNLGKIVRLVQWPAYFNATLERFRRDPRMLGLLKPLLGDNLKQIINQLHWKPPGADMVEFGYHQDIRSRRPRDAYRDPATSYIQTGIAVDAHRPDNGPMTFYPGSHKVGELPLPKRGHSMDKPKTDQDIVALGLDPGKIVPLVLEPGDVALWHLYTLHGSGPNRSATDRRFYINGYVAAPNCDRGEWAFRDGVPCRLGEPVLVHYEDLHTRPDPHYVDD